MFLIGVVQGKQYKYGGGVGVGREDRNCGGGGGALGKTIEVFC